MELRELRIGNNILCNGEEIEVCINDFAEWEDNDSVYCLKPIRIEEWLAKHGIEYTKARHYIFKIPRRKGKLIIKGYCAFLLGVYVGRVQYAHKLQNLWFTLTGEELTFKK